MAINVRIDSTFDAKGINQAVKDINSIKSKLASVQSSSKKTQDNFNAFTGTVKKLGLTIAATFGAREIGQFFSASIKGAIEDEKSLKVLNKTLANMGFRGATEQVGEFINKLQFSAGIADDQLRPALNNLVLATGNLTQSQKLLQVALDVSAGTGRDLDTITVALAKAYNGNFTALKKLNLGIDETLIKNKDLSGILTVLSQKFAGASANAVDTYAGKIQILQLAVGEAQETIGYALLNALDKATGGANNFAGEIQDLGQDVADIILGISNLASDLKDLAVGLGLTTYETKSLMDEQVGLGDQILQLIPIVGTYLKILKDQGEAERKAFAPDGGSMRASSRLARHAKENQQAIKQQEEATDALAKAQLELKKNTESLIETNKSYAQFVSGLSPQSIEGSTTLARESLSQIQKIMSGTPKINATLAQSFKELAGVVQKNFSFALEEAKNKLNAAKEQYNSFKSTIKTSITDVLSFSSIAEGSTFLDSLTQQAEQAKAFGGKIQQLLTMGLNERALTQIANAGYETGTVIADEIIAGGSTIVQQVNTLVASVETVGETVSTSLADQFYSAGVNAAQSLVNALITELNNSAAIIAAAIANATTGGTTPPPKKTPPPTRKTPPPPPKSSKPFNFGFRANGGPVTSGLSYLVGERGPEIFSPSTSGSIIPNNRTGSTSSANINITVNAGLGASGAVIGREIVDAIKKYERTSGPVFASA